MPKLTVSRLVHICRNPIGTSKHILNRMIGCNVEQFYIWDAKGNGKEEKKLENQKINESGVERFTNMLLNPVDSVPGPLTTKSLMTMGTSIDRSFSLPWRAVRNFRTFRPIKILLRLKC